MVAPGRCRTASGRFLRCIQAWTPADWHTREHPLPCLPPSAAGRTRTSDTSRAAQTLLHPVYLGGVVRQPMALHGTQTLGPLVFT